MGNDSMKNGMQSPKTTLRVPALQTGWLQYLGVIVARVSAVLRELETPRLLEILNSLFYVGWNPSVRRTVMLLLSGTPPTTHRDFNGHFLRIIAKRSDYRTLWNGKFATLTNALMIDCRSGLLRIHSTEQALMLQVHYKNRFGIWFPLYVSWTFRNTLVSRRHNHVG